MYLHYCLEYSHFVVGVKFTTLRGMEHVPSLLDSPLPDLFYFILIIYLFIFCYTSVVKDEYIFCLERPYYTILSTLLNPNSAKDQGYITFSAIFRSQDIDIL